MWIWGQCNFFSCHKINSFDQPILEFSWINIEGIVIALTTKDLKWIVFSFIFLPGFNLISPEWRKKCSENGVCRFECYGSEMLVAYCMSRLECCVRGNPVPWHEKPVTACCLESLWPSHLSESQIPQSNHNIVTHRSEEYLVFFHEPLKSHDLRFEE